MWKCLILVLLACAQAAYAQQAPSIPTGVDSLSLLGRLGLETVQIQVT